MLNYFKQKVLLPLFLLFFLLFDGSLMVLLSYSLTNEPYYISSAFFLIILILLAIYLPDTHYLLLLSPIFGFIYDSYYTSILGICLFLFPAIVLIVVFIKTKIPINLYSTWFLVILIYSLFYLLTYYIYLILDINSDSFMTFITYHYIPSLLFNALITFVLIWVIKKVADLVK